MLMWSDSCSTYQNMRCHNPYGPKVELRRRRNPKSEEGVPKFIILKYLSALINTVNNKVLRMLTVRDKQSITLVGPGLLLARYLNAPFQTQI